MRVLIADNDRASLYVLQSTLEAWGYQVDSGADGMAAWEVLQGTDPPRLALPDWMMPGMDGTEMCREIRKRRTEPYA